MCKQIYHHIPSCGHIANWTIESCVDFTNALRITPMAEALSCQKIETTHDLLPITSCILCLQCEREWLEEIGQRGLHGHRALGRGNMPIERLGSSEPVIEVQVKSSLGTEVDAESKGVSLEGGQEGKEPEPKDNASTESESKGDRRPSMIPLPPPRLVNIKKPPNPSKKQPKRPAPIATDACPFLYSKFDTPTPTSTPSSVEEPRSTQPLAPYPIIEHPNRNTYPVHDRVPFAARAPGTVNSFPSPSYYSPNSSRYGAGIHPGSVTISPLIPFLPRTEEYRHFSLTPEKNVHIVQGDLPRPESFRDGLCLRLPPHLWDLVAGRQ